MILCDLPYGTTRNKWDSVIDLDKLWAEYRRIIKDDGAIVLFAQLPFSVHLCQGAMDMLRYEWIWIKQQGTGFLNANRMPMKIHENILVFYKRLPTYHPQMGMRPVKERQGHGYHGSGSNYGAVKRTLSVDSVDVYPVDILRCKKDSPIVHPTQKPVSLCRYLIRTYTDSGDTVLDNCMGSGTTGVACVEEGRHFIGIEKDPGYFEMARKRILERIKG